MAKFRPCKVFVGLDGSGYVEYQGYNINRKIAICFDNGRELTSVLAWELTDDLSYTLRERYGLYGLHYLEEVLSDDIEEFIGDVLDITKLVKLLNEDEVSYEKA